MSYSLIASRATACRRLICSGVIFLLYLSSHSVQASETEVASGARSAVQSAISANGRFVAFATNGSLDANDTNTQSDIYVRDMDAGTNQLISVNNAGETGNELSLAPDISADGRYVVFTSLVDILGDGSSSTPKVYLRDRILGVTTLVSVAIDSGPPNAISGGASISANGQYVAFGSLASNLVNDDTNGQPDIFVRDLQAGITERVSLGRDGDGIEIETDGSPSTSPDISADGRYVVFESRAENLVDAVNNNAYDIFKYDRQNDTIKMISGIQLSGTPAELIPGNGNSRYPSVSDNGQLVTFQSDATNFSANDTGNSTDIYVAADNSDPVLISRSRLTGLAVGASIAPAMSPDGRYIRYFSRSNDLVSGDTNRSISDAFVIDLALGLTERINLSSDGVQDTGGLPSISLGLPNAFSSDGRYVTFVSTGNTLVPGVFLNNLYRRDRGSECDVTASSNQFILPNNEWRTLALPCAPPSGSTLGDIFADDISGDFMDTWTVYFYDPTLAPPDNVQASLDDVLIPGQGFWMIQNTGSSVTLDLPAGSRNTTGNYREPAGACIADSDGCFNIPLSGAPNSEVLWNLIGNPLPAGPSTTVNDLRVTTTAGACAASSGCNLTEAFDADIIFDTLFHYNGNSYDLRTTADNLNIWDGYWVAELPNAAANDPQIRFPQ